MKRRSGRVAAAVGGALAAAALAACTGGDATKAGAGDLPVTLTIATADGLETPYNRYVEEFARQVEDRSARRLRVEIDYNEQMSVDTERVIASEVRDGAIDLAHVPNRAFDLVGVDRLRALQAPYLIDTPELADAVLESDAMADMLADLRDDGYEVLGAYTEGIRRPAGYGRPLVGASDFDGLHLRVPRSEASFAMFEALGAHPEAQLSYTVGASGARLLGAETGLGWTGAVPQGSVFTANVGFYPKYNLIVMGTERYEELTDEHRRTLRDAAEAMRDHVATTRETESELAERICRGGGEVVFADDAGLESLRAAAEPVLEEMRRDPVFAGDLERLEALAADTPSEPFELPEWCGPPSGDGARL